MSLNKIIVSTMFLMSFSVFAEDKIPAGLYNIDPMHSKVGFEVSHLVVSTVEGRFNQFDGQLNISDKIEKSKVDVNIDVASIDTGTPKRDEHLKSADFFDVAKTPKIKFVSKKITQNKNDLKVFGVLTIKGKSKDVVLDAKYLGKFKDGYGQDKVAFKGKTSINRKDFGLAWSQMVEVGPVVGDNVDIILNLQAAAVVAKK